MGSYKTIAICLSVAIAILILVMVSTTRGREVSTAIGKKWPINRMTRSRAEPEQTTQTALRAGHEGAAPIIQKGVAQGNTDLLIVGDKAFKKAADEAFQDELNAMSNRNVFDTPLLPEPLTADQFRWTEDYAIKANDPFMSSPLVKMPINLGANPGKSLWTS